MQQVSQKKTLFSGIQPTGAVTIGNYIGALSNWVKMQDEYNCVFSVVDLHSITVRQEPEVLRKNTLELAALLLACGIDPQKSVLFIQSHVPAHAELTWALDCIAYIGELSRMTQFKDKSRRHSDNINMGLMNYPVLMAADILLYMTDVVPVGADQKQHLEIARDLAERFNARYGETFRIPQPYINKHGGKIMSLANPQVKMSKSDENPNAYIALDDDADTILRKIKRSVTDSGSEVKAGKDKAGITNLLAIYCCFGGKTLKEAEREFEGKNYGYFKNAVAESVINTLIPLQKRKKEILSDKAFIDKTLDSGREKAAEIANKTLSDVYAKIGFYR
jgi:tryptophanyl-tRNA synthetase